MDKLALENQRKLLENKRDKGKRRTPDDYTGSTLR